MGIYTEQLLPRIVDKTLGVATLRPIRARVCAGLAGAVVELGFGSGHNLPYMPAAVTKLYAIEPSAVGRRLAAARVAATPFPVEFAGLDGERLPLDDQSVDAALSTWTLCTIPDVAAALREVARVLRPGGALHFAEHGVAPDVGVRRWQDRLNGLQQRVAGGCRLNRDIPALLDGAGFEIDRLDTYYAEKEPRTHGYTYEGVARPRRSPGST